MEIYKDLSNPASQEFEKLLNSKLSKINSKKDVWPEFAKLFGGKL